LGQDRECKCEGGGDLWERKKIGREKGELGSLTVLALGRWGGLFLSPAGPISGTEERPREGWEGGGRKKKRLNPTEREEKNLIN